VLLSHFMNHETEGWNPKLCNNMLFFTLIGSQILHVFNMNSSSSNFFRSEIVRNRYVWYAVMACIAAMILLYEVTPLRKSLSIYPLTYADWLIIVAFSFSGLIVNQVAKKLKLIKQ
jgi:P-type Ca2+ transporter type 2C